MPAANRETLCFLHGWGFDGRVLEKFMEGFMPEWNVKALALPGYDGAAPAARGMEDVARLLAPGVPDHAVLIGWSLGGMIGIRIAAMKPVRKLIILAGAPCFVNKHNWPHGVPAELVEGLMQRIHENPAAALHEFAMLSSKGDGNPRATYRTLSLLLQQSAVRTEALRDGLEMLRDADLRTEFSGLSCRVGVILAENDRLFPAAGARAMLSLNPGLELRTVAGCGHALFISAPEQSRQALLALLASAPLS